LVYPLPLYLTPPPKTFNNKLFINDSVYAKV
jgi:hypothetical protein